MMWDECGNVSLALGFENQCVSRCNNWAVICKKNQKCERYSFLNCELLSEMIFLMRALRVLRYARLVNWSAMHMEWDDRPEKSSIIIDMSISFRPGKSVFSLIKMLLCDRFSVFSSSARDSALAIWRSSVLIVYKTDASSCLRITLPGSTDSGRKALLLIEFK